MNTKLKFALIAAGFTAILTGCAGPRESLRPATHDVDVSKKICVLPDDARRKEAYNRVIEGLNEKGFSKVEEKSDMRLNDCYYVMSCQSASEWGMSNFTTQIHLKLFEKGKVISEAHYTHKNNATFDKYINTKEMVNKMLNGMMPNTKRLKSRYE
ncbi:MAG: hypothetical protein IK089_02305 [Oxalobacter sp.]|nr:hypothetical protein [Oxalobacter sp.]